MSEPPRSGWASLSRRTQTIITILIMAAITAAGYIIGRDQPTPDWIAHGLIPALGWVGLLLIIIIVVDWIRRR